MGDGLESALRLRREALDQARLAMAEALTRQDQAEQGSLAAERTLVDEMKAASRADADDGAVEAFAAWLPAARDRVRAASDALAQAVAETAHARAAVLLTCAALEAAEALQARRRAEAEASQARRRQHALDDIVRMRHA